MARDSGSHDTIFDDNEHIPLAREAAARLLARVVALLGGSPAWTGDLEIRLRSLVAGFTELSPSFPAAAVWSDRLQQVLDSKPPLCTGDHVPGSLHGLAVLLAQQPAVTTRREACAAKAVGALVFYTMYRGSTLSQNFLDSLKQFYLSPAVHWQACRRSFVADAERLFPLAEDQREVVRDFIRSIWSLQDQGIYAPAELIEGAGQGSRDDELGDNAEDQEGQAIEASAPRRVPTRFFCEPRFDLLQFQIVQEEREPSLSQYRLDNDPNSLCEEEHTALWACLLPALRQDTAFDLRIHAAARALSVLAGLSLEVLASAPFADVRLPTDLGFSRGSLHIDLRVSLIRRDFLTVAPRADKDRARTHGRYLRTPIPPEVVAVLREARVALPAARTIGDLLVAAGLTPTICHAMVNEGRVQPRVFESLRIGRSFAGFLLRKGIHPSVVSHTTGDITLVPRAHHYYLSLDQRFVYQAVNVLCAAVGLEPVSERAVYRRLGSPNHRHLEVVRACFQGLQHQVLRARNHITNRSSLTELIKFHNYYVCSVTLQVLWGLGARCQNLKTLSVQALLAHPEIVLISDKASDRYSELRICVTTTVVQRSLVALAEHLRTMGHRLRRKEELATGDAMLRLVGGQSLGECAVPILYRDDEGVLTLRPPTRTDLKKVARATGMPALNTPRHFLLTELVERGVDAVEIDAQLGHHLVAAPPFGTASGLTVAAFVQSLQSTLTAIHECLGLESMSGLSSLQQERLKLPAVRLGDQIELPNNGYLRQAVEVADLNPPDILLAEEDCPWSWSTLAAHAELTRLRVTYLRTDLVARHPHGAALFCLVAFDAVISSLKLRWVWTQVKDQGVRQLRGLHVVEQIDADIAAQVLLHTFTSDALAKAINGLTWEDALAELKAVLVSLDVQWSNLTEQAAMERLLALVAHTLNLETAPLERFSVVHKAPFIPFEDLKRLLGGVGTIQVLQERAAFSPRERGAEYAPLFALLDHWADHDLQLGERKRREQGALEDLNQLLSSSLSYDEDLAIQWVRRELIDPPSRRLSLSTIRAYLRHVLKFFKWVRLAERVPLEAVEWVEIRTSLFPKETKKSGDTKNKDDTHRRWAWQHLVCFLAAQGFPVPRNVTFRALKVDVNYRPHLHAYITDEEVQAVIESLPLQCPTPRDWIIQELPLRRQVPLRPQEARYLKTRHLFPSGSWIVVTTSGHDHLKNRFARGLTRVPPLLKSDLLLHIERRHAALDTGTPNAFVPAGEAGYAAYEATQILIRDSLRGVTGRSDLRLYDLRACSITDLIAKPLPVLRALVDGFVQDPSASTTSLQHARGAVAAREARHSNVITTLRYYHLSGLLGVREQLNQALAPLPVSANYLAAVHGLTPDAVYAAEYRGRPVQSRKRDIQFPVEPVLPVARSVRDPGDESLLTRADLQKQLYAGVLALAGVPLLAAADRAGVHPARLAGVASYLEHAHSSSQLHGSMVHHGSVWKPHLETLSSWAAVHQLAICTLIAGPEGLKFREHNIAVRDAQGLVRAGQVWKDLQHVGVVARFHPGRSVSLAERAQLEPELARWSVHIGSAVARESVGRLSFALHDPTGKLSASSSPHVIGKTTNLIGHLMRMVVYLVSKE